MANSARGVWLLFHESRSHPLLKPIQALEWFPGIDDARANLRCRHDHGRGFTRYVYRSARRRQEVFPHVDGTSYAYVWLARLLPFEGAPDVSSEPHEIWRFGAHGGLRRTRTY